jgi:hypothetical protein
MKNNYLLYPIVIIAALALNACKKEKCQDPTNPKCENYDPCYGKKTINAFFKARPGDRGFKPPGEWCNLIQCDTFNESSVRFDIPDGNPENSTYEWQIGTEATPRTGKAFEVDFSTYLRDNGWERHVPVTLTIRTPLNNCMQNQEDTLKTVKRDLFFTMIPLRYRINDEKVTKFKGYFVGNESKEVILEFIRLDHGEEFRGVSARSLRVGFPFQDTVMSPWNSCGTEKCQNYLHYRVKFFNITTCGYSPELTGYLSEFESLFIGNENKIKEVYYFNKPSGLERYEFIGERME